MARFNKLSQALPSTTFAPIRTSLTATTVTAEGGAGYERDAESELFLLGATNMVGQDTHYESALARDDRYAALIKQLAVTDEGLEFLSDFLPWLRNDAGLRTAPFVGAAHAVAARKGMPDEMNILSNLVADVLQRADEPGELFAFWDATYGGQHPKALKRGAAKAIVRLYTEWSAMRWDTDSKAYRFGRMLDLTHPKLEAVEEAAIFQRKRSDDWPMRNESYIQTKRDLFSFLLKRMRGKAVEIPESLHAFKARERMDAVPADERRAWLSNVDNWPTMRATGMGWQAVASWLNGPLDSNFWAAMIPSMAPQALLMNLRNFDKAGIDDGSVEFVCGILSDEVRVRRARIMPLQVLAAYRATTDSLNWGRALSKTLEHSLANVPSFDGRTLIMVDTSYSMKDRLSADGEMERWDAAVVFAAALARRCEKADVVSFSSEPTRNWDGTLAPKTLVFPLKEGEALLKTVERWRAGGYFIGQGTATAGALRRHVRAGGINEAEGHTRVIVITDEQAGVDLTEVDRSVPAKIPLITLNLAGYRAGHAPAGSRNRVTIGGFNDSAFKLLAALDRSQKGRWPWQNSTAATSA